MAEWWENDEQVSAAPSASAAPAAADWWKADPVAAPAISGTGRTFGRNMDGSVDTTDAGRMSTFDAHHGAYHGVDLRDPELKGLAIGQRQAMELTGLKNGRQAQEALLGKTVHVINHETGQSTAVTVVDKAPVNQPHVEMTPAAHRAIGSNGSSRLTVTLPEAAAPPSDGAFDWSKDEVVTPSPATSMGNPIDPSTTAPESNRTGLRAPSPQWLQPLEKAVVAATFPQPEDAQGTPGVTKPLYQPEPLHGGQQIPVRDQSGVPTGETREIGNLEAGTTNVLRGFISGATSLKGLLGFFPPVYVANLIHSSPDLVRQVQESEKTPAGSQERVEAGLSVVAALGSTAALGKGMVEATRPKAAPPKAKMQTVGKSFADIPESVVQSTPPSAVQREGVTPQTPANSPGSGTVIEPGTIPIEGLPGVEAPAGEAPAAPSPAAAPLFRQDDSLPALTKIRIEDELKAAGAQDHEIDLMTTPEVTSAIDQLRASKDQQIRSTNETTTNAGFEQIGNSTADPIAAADGGGNPPGREIKPAGIAADQTARAQTEGTPLNTPEELAARRAYEAQLLDEAQQYQASGSDELHDALVASGGLPSRKSPHWSEELAQVEAHARAQLGSRSRAYRDLFRDDAPPQDDLATSLRDRGFDTPTADDVIALAEQRYSSNRQIYGQPPQVFASGTSRPRARIAIRPTEYRGRQGFSISGTDSAGKSVKIFAESREAADRIKARVASGEQTNVSDFEEKQGKLFASGTANPRPAATSPHSPAPRLPAPAPAPSAPVVAAAVKPLRSWWQARTLGIRKVVAPQTIDAPARMVANIVRDYNGQLANRILQADHALAEARADFDRTPVPSSWTYDPAQPLPRNYAFMAESEKGGASLSPADRQLKAQLDQMFEEAVDEVHRVKPQALQTLIQDYFPHVWKDPAAAQRAFASLVGSRPLEGSKTFLKQRTLAYIEDGLKLGLKPVSDNPIDIVLTKLHEVHKFVAAQDILTEAKAIGARKFVYIFEKAPEGWTKVDDPTSKVNAPPFVTVKEAFDEQMKVKTLELLDQLGIPHQRLAKLPGKRWGDFTTGGAGIRTKFAGPLSVYWHELGHALQERYGWIETILGDKYDKKGRYVGPVKPGSQAPIAKELRALADLRAEGQPANKSFQKYIRTADEKAAVLLEAYLHAPQRMEQVAPLAFGRVRKFINAHPELSPINDIRPSLVLGTGKTDVPVGGLVTLGHYYMPEGAAAVLNNYLSPGLQRFGIIRSIRQSTNVLSGLQLGFSAFHAGFTSIDAAVSQFALGLRYASEGKLTKAAARIVTTPAAPVTNYLTGLKVQRAMLDPTYGGPEVQNIAQLAVQAGLRATVDPFWKTQITRNLMRAWHEGGVKGYAGTVLRLPFAASEQMMRPILEYLVPRQKLGVFAGMAQQHMERLGPNADIHQVRDAMAKAADATEDRMGQMTYDNLFYNRVIRDTALLGFRAYGWTFGKYRALFGGLGDILQTPGRIAEGGPALTDRMAYLIALPMVAGAIGSVMNYTMTGELPQDWRDALMPRTGRLDRNGNPERLSLPTYVKDILSDWHDFPNTKKMLVSFSHKLNPWGAVAADIINNADFYNTKIYDEDAPFLQRQLEKLAHVMRSAAPFSVTSTLKLNESNPTIAQQALPFFGFVPAKAILSMTPAQARAAELSAAMLPQGARGQDQAAHAKLAADLLRDRRASDPGFYDALAEAQDAGQLHRGDRMRIERASQLSPFQYQVKRLGAPDAMKVWDLSNETERAQIRAIILQKIAKSKTLSSEQRTQFTQVLNAQPIR